MSDMRNFDKLQTLKCLGWMVVMMITAITSWSQVVMTPTTTTWSGEYTVSGDVTIDGSGNPSVRLEDDTTINLNEGATFTVNGRVDLYGAGDTSGNHSLTITGSGTMIVNSSSASGCISGLDCTLIINGGNVNLNYTGIEENVYAAPVDVVISGGSLFTSKKINGFNDFIIADGKYYKDETTGKCYIGTLSLKEKEEIIAHSFVETTKDEYNSNNWPHDVTASVDSGIVEIWAFIGTGINTDLPEGSIAVAPDTKVELSIEPKIGYKVMSVTVKCTDNTIIDVAYNADSDDYSFTMPKSDVKVNVTTDEANYPELPLTWNGNVATHTFDIKYAIYSFTPSQDGYYAFGNDKPSDVDIYVFDQTSDLKSSSNGYALAAGKTYYINIYPQTENDSGTFVLTVTYTPPTDFTLTANKATLNGVPKFWATFYHPSFSYQLPDGALALYMKSDHALYLVGDDGSVIPANTPVIIMKEIGGEADSVNVELTALQNNPDITVDDNYLHGTAYNTDVSTLSLEDDKNVYVMSKDGDSVCFKAYTNIIPAYKAYYVEE